MLVWPRWLLAAGGYVIGRKVLVSPAQRVVRQTGVVLRSRLDSGPGGAAATTTAGQRRAQSLRRPAVRIERKDGRN